MPEINKLEILKSICTEDGWGSAITAAPFYIRAAGKLWEFGTDGVRLLAFQAEESDLNAMPEKYGNTRNAIAEWLESKPNQLVKNPRQFANFLRLPECAKCPMCGGSGKRSLQWPDPNEGGGFPDSFLDEVRWVKIGDFPFNGNLIARTLVHLNITELESLPVRLAPHKKGAIIQLFGPDWTVVMMNAKPDKNDETAAAWTEFQPNEGEAS